jgi:filamentous hemagglutinin family protein
MKSTHELHGIQACRVAAILFGLALPFLAQANPQGMTVVAGSASAQVSGSQLNVTAGQNTFLNWSSFNIQQGETTTFIQPAANAVVLNNIGGNSPSQIWGTLHANGTVILANANGFYFGPNSMIKVGGSFIAATAPLPPDFGAGSTWQFTGMPPLAGIVNYGTVQVGQNKSLYLIAEQIGNHGNLSAPGGSIGLCAGKQVLLSERPDGRGLSAIVQMPSGSVDNTGNITADAGTIALQAQVVNQNGVIQADSAQNQNGVIELVASESLHLGANSQILARGDDTSPGSAAGSVTLKSANNFTDSAGSRIVATGGARGGNGGNIEISAPNILSLNSGMDAGAQSGWQGGQLLLDPANIVLGTSGGSGPDSTGTVAYNSGSGTLNINVNTAFANMNFSSILLQATTSITLAANTVWNLSQSTGLSSGQLTLQSGGNITIGTGAKIIDNNDWSVALEAGYDFANNTIQASSSGTGNINLNGGGKGSQSDPIQLFAGSLTLLAAQSITLGFGAVYTRGGGSIFAEALAGDIDLGSGNGGYVYYSDGSSSAPNPGGIATAAGGDVTLIAGGSIYRDPQATKTDTLTLGHSFGATGAYGPGDVTLIAGNQITGYYTLADGVGTILAGVAATSSQADQLRNSHGDPAAYAAALQGLESEVQQSQNPKGNIGIDQNNLVDLNLIKGAWSVWAANSIYIGEVRNPNGTFNNNALTVPAGEFVGNESDPTVPASVPFLFDYAPDAAVHLWAGNGITLDGSSLQRQTGYNDSMPPIYPPILTLNAGEGGITIDNSLFLYPSQQGALEMTTRDGGNLVGQVQAGSTALATITMSDSSQPGWVAIKNNEHALTPLHLDDPNAVTVDIDGSIGSFGLVVPTYAQITVNGNAPYTLENQNYFGTYNFGFSGLNLSPSQTTAINVAGDIMYRGDLTFEPLAPADVPPASLFSASTDSSITGRLRYDAATQQLFFIGVMSEPILAFLLNPTVYVLDAAGNQILNANGQPETTTLTLSGNAKAAIVNLYADSQSAQISNEGLALAGPGKFAIAANDIDLGVSGGIVVNPLDPTLLAIYPRGADLSVTTRGTLTMTSSEIANESWLGGVDINVGSSLDVGGQFTAFDDPNAAKGIFTTSGGNVSVTAAGNVNVNGSRIAAYNGGNVTVTSSQGDVNAGSGGSGYVSVVSQELDSDGNLVSLLQKIPGSGILATTLPGSSAPTLGNILINAPNGNVSASIGGVIEIAFNDADSRNSAITINAGRDINAGNSGIIGSNIKLNAQGNISGLVVGSGNVNINSQQAVNVTAVSGGNVSISAGTSVSGTVISGGNAEVSGSSITASLIASSVSASGDTAGASVGIPPSNVAKQDAKVADDASTSVTSGNSQDSDDEEQKRRAGGGPRLAKTTGRVTVILPTKPN